MKATICGFLSAATLLFGFSAAAWASSPPTDKEVADLKQKGVFEERAGHSQWWAHDRVVAGVAADALYRLRRTQLAQAGLGAEQIRKRLAEGPNGAFPFVQRPELPASGKPRTLTVLIEFPDFRASSTLPGLTPKSLQENIYGDGTVIAKNYKPFESVRNYYLRASEGKLGLSGDVLGWYMAKKNRDEYAVSEDNPEKWNRALLGLIAEALKSYDSTHDFSVYDNDHDGDIDQLNVIYTGPSGGWNSFWWAYQWNFFVQDAATVEFDGTRLNQFVFQFASTRRSPAGKLDFDPRTLIHETGHALGLPDYYDTKAEVGVAGGVGGLDMMDHNIGNHGAFSRWLLGWIEPKIVGSGRFDGAALVASGADKPGVKAIAVFPRLTNVQSPGGEMFLVENRARVGNDVATTVGAPPGQGLLIWHVNAQPNASQNDFLYDNSTSSRKLLKLVRADSALDFGDGDQATSRTYFSPPQVFNATSRPSSAGAGGSRTDIYVRNISAVSTEMKLDVGIDGVSTSIAAGPAAVAPSPAPSSPNAPAVYAPAPSSSSPDPIEAFATWAATATPAQLEARTRQLVTSLDGAGAADAAALLKIAIPAWASKDGRAAVDYVLGLKQAELKRLSYPRVMAAWAGSNPAAASRWYMRERTAAAGLPETLGAGARFGQLVSEWKRQTRQSDLDQFASMLKSGDEVWGLVEGVSAVDEREGTPSQVTTDFLRKLPGNSADVDTQLKFNQQIKVLRDLANSSNITPETRLLMSKDLDAINKAMATDISTEKGDM